MSIPRLSERPSFAQRDAYRDVLSEGYAQGRLTDDDFEVRLQLLQEATTLQDLEGLISDLPRGSIPVPVGGPDGSAAGRGTLAGQGGAAGRGRAAGAGASTGSSLGAGGQPALSRRAGLVVAAMLVLPLVAGVWVGAMTGSAARADGEPVGHDDAIAEADSGAEAQAAIPPSDVLDYRHVARGVEFAAKNEDATSVSIRTHAVFLMIPTASGTAYDTVFLHENGTTARTPGSLYADEEAPPLVDVDDLDVDVLTAIALAAPQVYEEHTGDTGLPVDRLEVDADHTDEGYAGVDPEEPVVEAWLATDEYGGGGGRVVWTLDGSRVLEVME